MTINLFSFTLKKEALGQQPKERKMNSKIVPPMIAVGTPIIYYNKWTGFETDVFREQFRHLPPEELKLLVVGDVVYLDIDPLHPAGKVYGRVKAIITQIDVLSNNELRFFYRGGHHLGFKTTHNLECHGIEKAVDEVILARIVADNPESKVIDPYFDEP